LTSENAMVLTATASARIVTAAIANAGRRAKVRSA
jgi:hypothetical protein